MTITDARRLQVRHFGASTLPEICSEVHKALWSTDTAPWPPQRFQEAREVLQAKLATWEYSRTGCSRFDNAVKALCEATLAELENRQ